MEAASELSSYAKITQQLVAYGLAEGLTHEKDLLDLQGGRSIQLSGEDLYYKEYDEFQRESSEEFEVLYNPHDDEARFDAFWEFMQVVRSGDYVRFRPALQRDQALNFLSIPAEQVSEREVRSLWMKEVFAIIKKYSPDFSGSPSDYEMLQDTPEAMFELSFLDAAYQRLEDLGLEQMQFTPPEVVWPAAPRPTAGPAARPSFVSQAQAAKAAQAAAVEAAAAEPVTVPDDPAAELKATLR